MTRDFSSHQDYLKEGQITGSNETTKLDHGLTILPINQEMYHRIKEYVYMMPDLLEYYSSSIVLPSTMLTPKLISEIQTKFTKDSEFYLQLSSFVNTVAILDIFYNGNGSDGFTLFHAISRMLRVTSNITVSPVIDVDVLRDDKKPNVLSARNNIKVSILDSIDVELHTHFLGMYLYSTICHLEGITLNKDEGKK